jgi:prolipoprotein diacylglyceryltransferase
VGQRFAVLLALYGLARFVNEWFRGDARRGWAIDEVLTNGQLTSIFMVLGALLVTIIGVRSRTLPRPNKLRAPQG